MIAGFPAHLREAHDIPGGDREGPALLPRIPRDFRLPESASPGVEGAAQDTGAEGGPEPAAKPGGRVGGSLRIDEHRAIEPGLREKVFCLSRGAVSDHRQLGLAAANLGQEVTQLRDLLATEDSPEVADEDQDHRSVAPEIAQALGPAFGIEHREWSEPFCRVHGRRVASPSTRREKVGSEISPDMAAGV